MIYLLCLIAACAFVSAVSDGLMIYLHVRETMRYRRMAEVQRHIDAQMDAIRIARLREGEPKGKKQNAEGN